MNDADMKNGTEGTKEEKLIAFIKEAKDSAGIVENFEWIGKLSRDKEQHYSRDSDYIHSLAFCIFDRKARTLFDEGKSFYEVLEETTKIAKMIGITVGDCATMGERYVLEFWALKSQAPAKLISDGKSFKEVVEKLGISYESTREALQCAFVRTGLIKHLKEGYPFSDFLLSIEMSFSSFLDDTKWKATHPFLSVEWKS